MDPFGQLQHVPNGFGHVHGSLGGLSIQSTQLAIFEVNTQHLLDVGDSVERFTGRCRISISIGMKQDLEQAGHGSTTEYQVHRVA